MSQIDLIVTPFGRKMMPESVRGFFPADVDGYLFLIIKDDGTAEVWKHIYADKHLWKEYTDNDHFVEVLDAQTAKNMMEAVERWNTEGAKIEKKAAEERNAKATEFKNWIETLPPNLAGFQREGEELLDMWGNTIFRLGSVQLAFKSVDEIEAAIFELIADGYEIE